MEGKSPKRTNVRETRRSTNDSSLESIGQLTHLGKDVLLCPVYLIFICVSVRLCVCSLLFVGRGYHFTP